MPDSDEAVLRRRGRVIAEMERSGCDFLVASSAGAVGYLTDVDIRPFSGAGTAVVLKSNGDSVLLVSDADRATVEDAGFAGDVRSWPIGPDAWLHRDTLVRDESFSENGGGQSRGAVETRTGASYQHVLAGIGSPHLTDAESIIDAAARVRDEDELRRVRQAANLADIGYTAVVDRMHPELRVLEITRNVDRSIRAAGGGGYWSPIEDDAGVTGESLYPLASIATLLGRRRETGVLDPNEPLPFALYPLSEVYAGAAGTTITLSPPSGELRSRAELLGDAVRAAIAAVRPGVNGGEVQSAFARELHGRADEASGQPVGYSIGTGINRPHLTAGSRDVLVPGTVVSVRGALSGETSTPVAYQTTVLVTEGGNEVLNTVPIRLIELY